MRILNFTLARNFVRSSYAALAILFVTTILISGISPSKTSSNSIKAYADPGHSVTQPVSTLKNNNLNLNTSSTYPSNSTDYYNWSGYAATSSQPFLEVTSTYIQPVVSCPEPGAWTVFWVGFDGFSNNTVEQSGTAAQCSSGTNPTPTYYAWWEMYPTNGIQEMTIKIKPGNKIQDTVTYNPANSEYSLAVKNLTNGQQFNQTAVCASDLTCARDSADWIVERPSISSGYTLLADWKKMTLSSDLAANSTTTVQNTVTNVMQPVSAFYNTDITMVNDPYTGENLATPGSLNKSGKQFTDTWLNTQ